MINRMVTFSFCLNGKLSLSTAQNKGSLAGKVKKKNQLAAKTILLAAILFVVLTGRSDKPV